MAGGEVANIPDEMQRHNAIRGLILMMHPLGYGAATPPRNVAASVAELHAIQCVAWVLSKYGVEIPGNNWGAPVAEGDCSGGRGISVSDDGVCVADFRGSGHPETAALVAFIATCASRSGFLAVANAGDAAGLADLCTTPPFYPVVSPLDLVEASEAIGTALGESVRLRLPLVPKTPANPRGLPPGKVPPGAPIPGGVEPFPWHVPAIVGGVALLGGVGALVYFSAAPPRVKNPARRRRRR